MFVEYGMNGFGHVLPFISLLFDLRYCTDMDASLILLITSVDSQEAAESLAKGLVEARLAACVQISTSGVSVYRWQGKMEVSGEYYLSIKTTPEALDDAITWLHKQHPYDVPEIVWWPVQASEAYTRWAHASLERPSA